MFSCCCFPQVVEALPEGQHLKGSHTLQMGQHVHAITTNTWLGNMAHLVPHHRCEPCLPVCMPLLLLLITASTVAFLWFVFLCCCSRNVVEDLAESRNQRATYNATAVQTLAWQNNLRSTYVRTWHSFEQYCNFGWQVLVFVTT